MAEVATLREYVLTYMQTWSNKWLNEDGTAKEVPYETAVQYCVDEITTQYAVMTTIGATIDDLATVMNSNTQQYETNFQAIDKALTQVYTTIGDNNTVFGEQLQNISAQMSNQNKVLDNQVIKLAKSISDRRK